MPLEKLTRSRIVAALNLLGELAEQEDVTFELCLFGGSAMMLAYSAKRGVSENLDLGFCLPQSSDSMEGRRRVKKFPCQVGFLAPVVARKRW